jgi:hypothetical protein
MIIAKQTNQEQPNNKYYELFQPIEMIGLDGKNTKVLQSIGSYSIEQLEAEKQNLLSAIASIDEKIEAINNLGQ